MNGFWFHERLEHDGNPAGITVSKNEKLPDGDFQLDEYSWGSITLWFLESDGFTADERESAYRSHLHNLGYLAHISTPTNPTR